MLKLILKALFVSYVAITFVLLETNPLNWTEGWRLILLLLTFVGWLFQISVFSYEEVKPVTRRVTPTLEEKDNGR